jgi:LacI family transcriptional regulator
MQARWYRRPTAIREPALREGHLADWLRIQARPLGVFLHQDLAAHWFRGYCRKHGFRVPDEIAILGVDDDEYACRRDEPHLSSVAIPWTAIGREMGLVLHRALTSGSVSPPAPVTPVRVRGRASTAMPVPGDGLVAKAMAIVRRRIRHPPAVADLARDLGVSRATLYRRFVAAAGLTPQQYLMRERLRMAEELLVTSDAPIAEIARACGFASALRFGQAFKGATGSPPSRFRAVALDR